MFHHKGQFELSSFQRTSWLLWLCALMFTVSISEADYNFTVRFFEFRNPLGLQCDDCGNGGPPACCDDVQRLENCTNVRPFTCDTRFRFLLRTFGASVETAPNTGFPEFTPNSGGNSETFNEGPLRLLGLPNPFMFTRTEEWSGRIQFFIDAIDRVVDMDTSGISETLLIINRYPIDLELNPGPNFTERTTYTGFYNISDVGFDMSFRVQCLENYFGLNCTTFCEPLEGVNTCDSEGRFVCLNNRDLTTNCTTCLPNYDPEQNCTQCLLRRTLSSNCTKCLPGFDIMTDCTECLPGYEFISNQMQCSKIPTKATTTAVSGGADLLAVSGVIGTIAILLVILVVVLSTIMVVMIIRQKRQKQEKGLVSDGEDGTELATGGERDFENPLYDESTQGKGNNQGQESPKKVDLGVELEESQPLVEAIDGSGGKEDATEEVTQNTNPPPSLAAEVTTIEASVQEGEDDTTPHEIADPDTAATESQQSSQKGTEYADIVISPAASLGPDTAQGGPAEHDYATTEVAKQPESMQQASADYTNTTPGIITQEALSHYDFGQ